ncbi:latent-transforming growth factor beta-binding protein 1-like [Pangasianodon hypophthalmus]|uniref:latent-transforming growth factor beta-binding protein 1-like n=1 Tax=Pangasianodon hypophthalmus TaxID=310915 RepID=UPI002307CC94|nr:latent-transforming growth factor beta-binding protein 1-like [Pangasianodon hypophthalmus]
MLPWTNLFICAFGCVFLIFICISETKKPPVGLISPGNSQTESNPGFNSTGLKHKRGQKHIQYSTNRTRIQIDLSGPNVCGTRCCPGWIVHPKTKKCTKSKCSPRCYNRPMCRKRSVCQCGLHSQHCKQNQTISSSEITPTPVTVPEAMPTYRTTPSPVTPTPARTDSNSMEKYSVRWKPLSLKEAQAMLMRKALVRAVGGNKIVNILLKHIEAERNRLQSCNCTDEKTSTKTLYTQQGQYTLIYTPGQCVFLNTHHQHHKSSTNTKHHTPSQSSIKHSHLNILTTLI